MTSHTVSTLEKEYNAAKKAVTDLAPSVTKARKRTKRALDEKNEILLEKSRRTRAIAELKRYLEQSKKNEPDPHDSVRYLVKGIPRENRTAKHLERDCPSGRKCEKCGKKPRFARTPGYYFSHYSDYCCRDCYIENMAERKSGKGLSVCLECEKEERTSLLVFNPILIPDRPGYKRKGKKKTCNLCGTSDLTHLHDAVGKIWNRVSRGSPYQSDPVYCLYCRGDLRRVEIFPSKVVKGQVFCHYCKDSERKANSHLGKHRTAKQRREDDLRKELNTAKEKLGETGSSSKDAETKYLDLRSKRSSLEKELKGKKKARDDLHDRILLVKKRKADKVAAKREAKRKAEEDKRKAEEDKRKAEEDKRKAKRKAEEDKRKAKRKAEEDKRKAEEDKRHRDERAKRKAEEDKRKAEMEKAKRDREKRLRKNKKQLKLLDVSDKLLGLINDEGTVDLSIVSQIHKEDWVQQSPSSDGMDEVIDCLLNKTGNNKLTIEQGKYLNLHREHRALLKGVAKNPRKFDWAKSLLDGGFSTSWEATEAIVDGLDEDLARERWGIEPIRKPEPKPKPTPKPEPKPIPKPRNKNGGGNSRRPNRFKDRGGEE
jgi:hypothetical protein